MAVPKEETKGIRMPSVKASRKDASIASRNNFLMPGKNLIYGLMGFLLVYAIVRSLVAAAEKPFWFDELMTLTVSAQGTWNAILTPLRRALDAQPPLFYMIEHFASRLTRNKEIALRLPSILAFPCTLTCVFIYVKRRSGEIVAFLCAVFLLMTSVFQFYAVEARPYSMVVACIAFALVCYQRVPSPLWTVLLAMSLALAESLHYLAVLAMVPFGLTEAALFLKTRRFRWPVWAALVVGALPLLLSWKLLAITKAYYGARLWSRFQFSFIPRTYGELFQTNSEYGAAIGAVTLAGVLGTVLWTRSLKPSDTEDKSDDLAEATLVITFVTLPFLGYLITSVVHSGLTARYLLSTVIGVSVAFGYILSRARLGAVGLFAVFVFSAVGVHELSFWRSSRGHINDVNSSGVAAEAFIEGAGHKELPVVVPEGLLLVQLVHYASPSFASRFVYVTQDHSPNDKNWSDSVEKEIQLLPPYLPLRVSNFLEFTSGRREFLLYVEEKDPGRDWLTLRLSREGWSLQTVALDEWRRVYLVTGKGNSSCH
jgi:hypothetical protein